LDLYKKDYPSIDSIESLKNLWIEKNNDDSVFLNPDSSNPIKHKLNGLVFDKSLNVADVKDKCFQVFKNAIDPNNFKGDFISEGGTPPQQETLDLLDKINKEATQTTGAPTDINYYIQKYMTRFMNNRIGTYLKEQEHINIRKDTMNSVNPGNIVVHDEGNGNSKFVLLLGISNGVASIITKEDNQPDYIQKDNIALTSLSNYSRHEPIVQTYKPNEANLTEEAIIETYNIVSNNTK